MTILMLTSLLVMAALIIASLFVMCRPLMKDRQPLAALVIFIGMASSLGLYASYGSFGLPDQPLSERGTELAEAEQAETERQALGQSELQDALKDAEAHPDDLEAQFRLADAAAAAGNSEIEINTLKLILRKTGNPLLKSMIGEALTRQADGIVTTRALAWIEDGLSEMPDDWRGRYLKGLYLSQSGDDFAALDIWSSLAEDLNGSEIFPAIAGAITEAANRIGANPDAYLPEALPDETDINAMVEGLEAELTGVENNRARWAMLVRSLSNLGEVERRDQAIARYLELMPGNIDDLPLLLNFTEVLLPLEALPETMPTVLTPLLKEAQRIAPDDHSVLFFSGLLARSQGDQDALRENWQQLLSKLDPSNPLFALLEQELNKNLSK